MSIIVNKLSFAYCNKPKLLNDLSFSIATGSKVSLVGANGSGKTTLLKILSGEITPGGGEFSISEPPFVVPQHFGQYDQMTIASALGVDSRLRALNAIVAGSTDPADYECLNDQWDIEEKLNSGLWDWGLGHLSAETRFSSMSGGEKTRAFLTGISLLSPRVILMDEPTNHLDRGIRLKLYDYILRSSATVLIVSHDRELLNLVDTTLEITPKGIKRYGGNYDFYKELRDEHTISTLGRISEQEKSIKNASHAFKKAAESKSRADSRGKKKKEAERMPRIMMRTLKDTAEKSSSRLKNVMNERIDIKTRDLQDMKNELPEMSRVKIKLIDPDNHSGRILIEAKQINFGYTERNLWPRPVDLVITSGDRWAVEGNNGSGKTTLLKILTGELSPGCGSVKSNNFSYIHIDQEYSLIEDHLTLLGQIEKHNVRNLADHELKTELHRFLFPATKWDNLCGELSGGEKMRLLLCCLMIRNEAPDLFILDEPTNNLDLDSIGILTSVLKDFKGAVIVISHDQRFIEEIGVSKKLRLWRIDERP